MDTARLTGDSRTLKRIMAVLAVTEVRAVKEFFEKNSKRLTVYRLPSYSPDYNPTEKLRKKIKEKEVHLHYFPTFESLRNRVEEGQLSFSNLKKEVLSLFVFYNELSGECSE